MMDDSAKAFDNVLGQLRTDHDEMHALLRRHERESSQSARHAVLVKLCRVVRLHFSLEAGVFVPIIAAASNNPGLLEETGSAYAYVIGIVNGLATLRPGHMPEGGLLNELNDCIQNHTESAEADEGFLTQASRFAIDWKSMEKQLTKRRLELTAWLSKR